MADRIQREVEELLEQLDQFPPKKPVKRRISDTMGAPFRAIGDFVSGIHVPSVSAGHLLLVAIGVIVVAYLVGGSSNLWNYIIAGGVVLFIVAFALSLRRQSKPPDKYWRDQPLDLRRGGGRNWFGRRRNKR
jgi:hypothetical protein